MVLQRMQLLKIRESFVVQHKSSVLVLVLMPTQVFIPGMILSCIHHEIQAYLIIFIFVTFTVVRRQGSVHVLSVSLVYKSV